MGKRKSNSPINKPPSRSPQERVDAGGAARDAFNGEHWDEVERDLGPEATEEDVVGELDARWMHEVVGRERD